MRRLLEHAALPPHAMVTKLLTVVACIDHCSILKKALLLQLAKDLPYMVIKLLDSSIVADESPSRDLLVRKLSREVFPERLKRASAPSAAPAPLKLV